MSMLINKITSLYNLVQYDLADYRTKDYYFMNPICVFSFVFIYIWFVLKAGPEFMKNRPAYNLKKVILAFDALQIVINAWTCFKAIKFGWLWRMSPFCEPIAMEDNDLNREIALYCYIYYLIKVSDLLDTIFFVFTKKTNHISFLHVYHHSGMLLLTWACAKYLPGGHHTFIGLINTFVHVVMYTYYLVTTVYPQKKLFKVKKLVTEVQMYQFLLAFVHMSLVHFTPNCTYPKWTNFFLLPNNLMIFILFYDFYKKTYFPKEIKRS